MLARTSTLYALLEQYPFLESALSARHPVFEPLARPAARRTWARVITLGELATAMNLPWLEFLRELQEEVRRATGAAPLIVEDVAGMAPDPRLGGELRSILRELEGGAPLGELATRLDALTEGLDSEGVAVLARDIISGGEPSVSELGLAAGQSGDWPAARLTLHPGHPVRALHDETVRLRELAVHIEELIDGLGEPLTGERWRRARVALCGLLAQLAELERQQRRLRLAWYSTLSGRGGQGVTALVDAALGAAEEAIGRAHVTAQKGGPETAIGAARHATELVRRALAAEEELLVPAALRVMDDDDWEAVAEQERVVGWALGRDQAV